MNNDKGKVCFPLINFSNMFDILPDKNINDYNEVIQFCDKNYYHLKDGTSRKVYDIGNGYVIKAAFNQKGIYQNQSEIRISEQMKDDGLILPIECYTDLWVIQKKVEPLTKETTNLFNDLYDISFNKLCALITYCNIKILEKKNVYHYKNINDFAYSIEKFLYKTKSIFCSDYRKIDSWGFLDNRIYIIDYGMDNITYDKYRKNVK